MLHHDILEYILIMDFLQKIYLIPIILPTAFFFYICVIFTNEILLFIQMFSSKLKIDLHLFVIVKNQYYYYSFQISTQKQVHL
jgi:hypothetical protein